MRIGAGTSAKIDRSVTKTVFCECSDLLESANAESRFSVGIFTLLLLKRI